MIKAADMLANKTDLLILLKNGINIWRRDNDEEAMQSRIDRDKRRLDVLRADLAGHPLAKNRPARLPLSRIINLSLV